ncbi:hypothetical protein OXIME_000779 [Oxyplasma meridianum]|uniref:Uncharacterized protein n=1 Tax=Oxyplasma meridianum TaxID=3073602 RepID=A0AAX4NFM2_9ARCH
MVQKITVYIDLDKYHRDDSLEKKNVISLILPKGESKGAVYAIEVLDKSSAPSWIEYHLRPNDAYVNYV